MIQIATAIAATVLGIIAIMVMAPIPVRIVSDWTSKRDARHGKRTLIWGAGALGMQIAIHFISDPEQLKKRNIIGFLDDNSKKTGQKIKLELSMDRDLVLKAGPYSIWGTTDNLEDLVKRLKVDEIVRGFDQGDESKISKVEKFCADNNIKYIDGSKNCRCKLPLPVDA